MSQPEFDPVGPSGIAARKQKANIYTVLLVVALVALLMGCLFLFLEINEYGGFGSASGPVAAIDAPHAPSATSPVQERPAIMPSPTLFASVD